MNSIDSQTQLYIAVLLLPFIFLAAGVFLLAAIFYVAVEDGIKEYFN